MDNGFIIAVLLTKLIYNKTYSCIPFLITITCITITKKTQFQLKCNYYWTSYSLTQIKLQLSPSLSREMKMTQHVYFNTAVKSQPAVAADFSSQQLLLFVFARRSVCQYSMAEENPAAQRQTAITAYFSSKQLALFAFI